MKQEGAPQILLPRPNPGPEPWPSPWTRVRPELAVLAVIAGLILGIRLARRARRAPAGETERDRPPARPAETSPFERLSRRVRSLCVGLAGPASAAWTTEEFAGSSELLERLGAETHRELIALLEAADRARFSGVTPTDETVQRWEAWARRFENAARDGAAARDQPGGSGTGRAGA